MWQRAGKQAVTHTGVPAAKVPLIGAATTEAKPNVCVECSVNFRVLKLAADCVVALVNTWWQQFATGGRLYIPAEKDDPHSTGLG